MDLEVGKFGWTESHYLSQGEVDLATALAKLHVLAGKRAKLLGAQGVIPAIHVSVVGGKRQYEVDSFPNDPYTGNESFDCASPQIAILCSKANSAAGRNANMYLRGFFDDIEVQGGKLITTETNAGAVSAFQSAWTAYQSYLINDSPGFGFLSKANTSTEGRILGVDSTATLQVGFVVQAGTFLDAEKNTKVQVRLSGLNGCANLNGPMVVYVGDPVTTATSLKQIAIQPWGGAGKVIVRRVGFLRYTSIGRERTVRKATGRPKGVSPAKSKAIIRG